MTNDKSHSTLFFSRTNEYLNHYLPQQVHKSKHTIETYRDALTIFRRFVTNQKQASLKTFYFEDCTYEFLLDYLAFLKDSDCAESTCNNRLTAVRAYLWYASACDISLQSIAISASKVPLLKLPKRNRETMETNDLAALLDAPAHTKIGLRDRVIMTLLYDAALRVSELLELKVTSLNHTASIPFLRVKGKGDKERIVSITDRTCAHLVKYISKYHQDYFGEAPLFYTIIKSRQNMMSPGNVGRIIKKYTNQIRPLHPTLPHKVYPHMFRRTRATNLYQNGVELELIARILGHSSTETTRIYAIPSLDMIRKAMEQCEISGNEEPLWPEDDDEIARLCGLR
jgi:site-specific recombinase XerD